MYNEDSYTRHLTLLKVKRVFSMILFSIIGCIIGVLVSSFVVTVLMYNSMFSPIIIAVSTLLFFFISLFVTGNTSKEISKKLYKLYNLEKLDQIFNLDFEEENNNNNNSSSSNKI